MLPLAESLLNRALDSKRAAEEIDSELSSLSRRIHTSGGMAVDVAKVTSRRSELEQSIQRVRETLGEIDEIGVQVKDLDTGLLDFPCRIDDEVVLLCWKSGEPVTIPSIGTPWNPASKAGSPSTTASAAAQILEAPTPRPN